MTDQELNIYRAIDVTVRDSSMLVDTGVYYRNDRSLEQFGLDKLKSHLYRYLSWVDHRDEIERFALYQGAEHCLIMCSYHNNHYQLLVEEGHPLLSVSLLGVGHWMEKKDFPLINSILGELDDSPALLYNWWSLLGQPRPNDLTTNMLNEQYRHYFDGYLVPDLGEVKS